MVNESVSIVKLAVTIILCASIMLLAVLLFIQGRNAAGLLLNDTSDAVVQAGGGVFSELADKAAPGEEFSLPLAAAFGLLERNASLIYEIIIVSGSAEDEADAIRFIPPVGNSRLWHNADVAADLDGYTGPGWCARNVIQGLSGRVWLEVSAADGGSSGYSVRVSAKSFAEF